VNDKLFALTDGYTGKAGAIGTYADYVRIREEWAAPAPDALPLREAGGVPLVALTAWQAILAGQPKAGQRMLILGASGGVGHFAVQFAKARSGDGELKMFPCAHAPD
jgi:NADPH:quinone reductase-like Zn-dependent oxidoreductase